MFDKQIIGAINTFIAGKLSDKRFSNVKYHGIAAFIKQDEKYFPALVDLPEIQFAGFDDNYNMVLYHRVDSFVPQPQIKDGWGDGQSMISITSNNICVVYGDRANLTLTQEELATLVAVSFPNTFSQTRINSTGLMNIRITVKSVNNRSDLVWSTEFRGIPYALPPEKILFSVNYQVETQFNQSCFEPCKNC